MPLLDALQSAETFPEVRDAVCAATPDELDARRGFERLRSALTLCADRIGVARAVILEFLGQALGADTVADIDRLAALFQKKIAAVTDSPGSQEEEGFWRTILERPGDDTPLLVYADWLDELGRARGTLNRLELERAANPPYDRRQEIEAEYARSRYTHLEQTFEAFGLPWPDDWAWDAEQSQERRESMPESALTVFDGLPVPVQLDLLQTLLRLPEQWADQYRLLRDSGLLQHDGVEEGVWSQARGWHRLPAYGRPDDPPTVSLLGLLRHCPQEYRTRLFRASLQGFTGLSLVPFALPLPCFFNALRKSFLHRMNRFSDCLLPTSLQTDYVDDEVRYDPAAFQPSHGGLTKQEAMCAAGRGWRVELVEDVVDLPLPGEGRVIAGRYQRECGVPPSAALDAQQNLGETGWYPELYALRAMQLARAGITLDAGTATSLTGSFLLSGYVPCVSIFPSDHRMHFGLSHSETAFPRLGVRGTIRLM